MQVGPKVLAGIVSMLLLAWCAPLPAQAQTPESEGEGILGAACSLCHGLGYITRSNRSSAEWQGMVSDMVARGAPLLPGEISIVLDYLATNYGLASPKVNVNKASAKELEAALGLTITEVEPIIRYRNQKGSFANWEDLKKVPGLDLTKVESVKDHITFESQ